MPARYRMWLAIGAATQLLLVLLPWMVSFGPLEGDVPGTLAATVVIGVPALLLARAMRRGDLDLRLRQALGLLALSMSLSVAGNVLRLASALGVPLPDVPGISLASNVIVWAIGLAALIRIPLVRIGRGARWQIVTDTTITVGGLALAILRHLDAIPVLEVGDTGRGIAPADLAKVCEPFFSSRPTHEGRGLGLSVVYGMMSSAAGGLAIESTVGAGTRVSVYFAV